MSKVQFVIINITTAEDKQESIFAISKPTGISNDNLKQITNIFTGEMSIPELLEAFPDYKELFETLDTAADQAIHQLKKSK